jgi:hypothetical protein
MQSNTIKQAVEIPKGAETCTSRAKRQAKRCPTWVVPCPNRVRCGVREAIVEDPGRGNTGSHVYTGIWPAELFTGRRLQLNCSETASNAAGKRFRYGKSPYAFENPDSNINLNRP